MNIINNLSEQALTKETSIFQKGKKMKIEICSINSNYLPTLKQSLRSWRKKKKKQISGNTCLCKKITSAEVINFYPYFFFSLILETCKIVRKHSLVAHYLLHDCHLCLCICRICTQKIQRSVHVHDTYPQWDRFQSNKNWFPSLEKHFTRLFDFIAKCNSLSIDTLSAVIQMKLTLLQVDSSFKNIKSTSSSLLSV